MAVTIPEAADYGTPVPQARGGTAPYTVPNAAQIDAAPWLYAGNAAAKAASDIGGELDKWGQQIETTQAQDALNQLRAKRQELTSGDNGFLKVQGKGVLDKGPDGLTIYEKYPQQLQASMDEIGSKLFGARAQQLFRAAAAGEVTAYKSDVAKHGISETEKYQAGTYKDTNLQLTNRALEVAEDPKALETVLGSIERATLARAAQLGIPGEGMAKGAVSDAVSLVVKRAIATGDSSKALSTFDAYKDKLDAKDSILLGEQIKTLRIGDTAKAQAGELLSGLPSNPKAEEGTKQSLQFWKGAGYSEKVSAGMTAGFLRESQFDTGARNKGDGRDGSDSIHIGQWNSTRATALANFTKQNNLDPKDIETGLKYAKAEIDGVIPYSVSGLKPDLKDKLQNAKSEKEAADIMTRDYFKPLNTAGESAHRGRSATEILAKYGNNDPLQAGVDAATGVAPAKSGPRYIDTRQMLMDADTSYDAATRRNNEINATNDAQRRATQSQLDINLAAQKRQIEMAKLDLEMKVDNWMQTGGPNGTAATTRPPPEIWNQLHYEKQKSIDATIAHNVKGADVVTDQQAWYEIQKGLTSDDPMERNRWANQPLWEYKPKLSNSDFQELAKLQGAVRKGDPEKQTTHVRNINQMVDDVLLKLKIDTTPKPGSTDAEKALKFRRAVQDKITGIEAEQGKKATVEQQQKVIDGMAMDVVTSKGMLWDSTKPRYEMTIKDVPDAERAKIGDALKRAGIPASDQTILDLFARKNAKPQ